MYELTLEMMDNDEFINTVDSTAAYFYIHRFSPNQVIEWWKTDLKCKGGEVFEHLEVRQMEMDVRTDAEGLKKIIDLNTHQLSIYQFEKPIPDTLVLDYLPEDKRDLILKQNGLKHIYYVNFETLTIRSWEKEFLEIWQIYK